ncbi:MAG: UDP-glucose 4-epimerase GalE [Neisseriaceae bacterium]|nr:UDP-glucose 4-epimerase GalE [Neisseriaceae bacterium]
MKVLVTGGAGYIGSHTVVSLLENNHHVIVLDNLSNSSADVLKRIHAITGRELVFYQGDVRDFSLLQDIFSKHSIDAVMHFAGLKSVGDSVLNPIEYYDNNVSGSLSLIKAMKKAGVFTLIFSSTATVYGNPQSLPIYENMPTGQTINPYGTSKYMVERILHDIAAADKRFSMIVLRYFNPIGAHTSGLIGESPNGIPNNLLPYICQVASGKLAQLSVFGNDYPTHDGSGVRDYIHVVDLAYGHILAMNKHHKNSGVHIYNLGTGRGYSVFEIIQSFERVNKVHIPYSITKRRDGDIAICYANVDKANRILQWQAKYNLDDMLKDAWHWQQYLSQSNN